MLYGAGQPVFLPIANRLRPDPHLAEQPRPTDISGSANPTLRFGCRVAVDFGADRARGRGAGISGSIPTGISLPCTGHFDSPYGNLGGGLPRRAGDIRLASRPRPLGAGNRNCACLDPKHSEGKNPGGCRPVSYGRVLRGVPLPRLSICSDGGETRTRYPGAGFFPRWPSAWPIATRDIPESSGHRCWEPCLPTRWCFMEVFTLRWWRTLSWMQQPWLG